MARANLHPDLRAFLASLNSAGVRYLLVGGYAVNFHGYHRATDDMDVWVAVDPANAKLLSRVMQEFGDFPASQVPPALFLQPGKVIMFGREPVRIDVLTGPSGVDFDACYKRRVVADVDDVPIPFIALEDLRANKQASGRTKDLADLENLPTPPPTRRSVPRKKRRPPRRK